MATATPRFEPASVFPEESTQTTFEKRLAAAIIGESVRDFMAPRPQHPSNLKRWRTAKDEAAEFLFGGDSNVEFWCAVAGWDLAWVRRKARKG